MIALILKILMLSYCMASILIRNLDESIKRRLRVLAAEQGHSMEEQARIILEATFGAPKTPERGLGRAISELFQGAPTEGHAHRPRQKLKPPQDFSKW